jgi:hypothetical protein
LWAVEAELVFLPINSGVVGLKPIFTQDNLDTWQREDVEGLGEFEIAKGATQRVSNA